MKKEMHSKIITVPIRLISEANTQDHWTKKYKRKMKVKKAILRFLSIVEKPSLPCKVILTRIAPRELDIDNLWTSLKSSIDVCADWITPGLAPGRADGQKGLEFDCKQRKGKVREYALEINIVQ